MGSETIPPCKENIIHITLDNPIQLPACQFNLLRDHSLVKTRAKEIHTRIEVARNDRPIYYFNKKALSFIPSVTGIIPESYEKYTLTDTKENRQIQKEIRRKKELTRNRVFRRFKTKTIIKMVNGKPIKKKIRVEVKRKTLSPHAKKINLAKRISQKIAQNKRNSGFGPGFTKGKKIPQSQLSDSSCTI